MLERFRILAATSILEINGTPIAERRMEARK
jgi:hypothetical protein